MRPLIAYFASRHFLSNLILAIVVAGGFYAAYEIRKEELPDFARDQVTITTVYPGASPQEVEQAITQPMENELTGLEHIRRIDSTSRRGSSKLSIELRRGITSTELAVMEIQSRIQRVKLPVEVESPPEVRHFKSSQKAVIDILLYFKGISFLKPEERRRLQRLARQLEDRLLHRSQISALTRRSYFPEEIHVIPRSRDLLIHRMGLDTLRRSLIAAHTDKPLGLMETPDREQVRLSGRLERPRAFLDVPLRTSFLGPAVRLRDVADVRYAFSDPLEFVRVNGSEAIELNVVKSSVTGILEAVDITEREVRQFLASAREREPLLQIRLMDDESYDVRNRLSLISGNALLGLALIIVVLSIFLNPRTAFWVALGIPFSFLFALICAYIFDYTINNMSLAGVIIAMGMLVDDAIVVSENVARLRETGHGILEASIEGTLAVTGPIVASVLTTIAAFLPLLAFEGNFALLSTTIPPIVAMVLLGSLLESVFVLPGHLRSDPVGILRAGLRRLLGRPNRTETSDLSRPGRAATWLGGWEGGYIRLLVRVLHHRTLFMGILLAFIVGAFVIFFAVMRFSLFPRETMKNFFIVAVAPPKTKLYETGRLAIPLERLIQPYVGKEVLGVRSQVGYRRYRPSGEENVVSVRVEFDEARATPERISALLRNVRAGMKKVKGFRTMRIATQRFGSRSGSAIEVLVQEDQGARRGRVAEALAAELRKVKALGYVEIDRPGGLFEYRLVPNRPLLGRLNVDMTELQATLRAALAGDRLFSFYEENEEKHVRLRFGARSRTDMRLLLQLPTNNREGYQVRLGVLVKPRRVPAVSEIQRVGRRRVLKVSADIKPGSRRTPLALAEHLESVIFPKLTKASPTTSFIFDGEVADTREASTFFGWAIAGVLMLVYLILSLQFSSAGKPFIIMTAILPAWAAAVYVFLLHGKAVWGFFTVVGALGLSGIVVNSSILLLDKLQDVGTAFDSADALFRDIAARAATRFRAVFLTTVTTVVGLLPSAYGFLGYDSMLADMMLTLSWGLVVSSFATLLLVPVLASFQLQRRVRGGAR